MDHDGDTDMSRLSPTSPRNSRDSRSVSANPYYNNQGLSTDYEDYGDSTPLARGGRGISVSTAENSEMGRMYDGMYEGENQTAIQSGNHGRSENLGVVNTMHQVEADSSDSSIRPPPRRQGRRPQGPARVQQYDPRISMMFAEHQAVRGTGSPENPISFDDWEESEEPDRYIEPASRNRRMTAYRNMPARRVDPLRSSRSPSSTRVISSSQRNARLPRQYSRRG